jgi:hypothetical protein
MRIAMLVAGAGLLWTGCSASSSTQGSTTGQPGGGTTAAAGTTGGAAGSTGASSTGSSGTNGTAGTTGEGTGGCGACNVGENCVGGQCQCDPQTCTGDRTCADNRCIYDPCKENGIANEGHSCLQNMDCGCPLMCQKLAGATDGICERPCNTTADCSLPDTSCQQSFCQQNLCGNDTGNGVLNGQCNSLAQNDGSCVPHTRPGADGGVYGVCVQNGCSLGSCLSGVDRSETFALCAPGYTCLGPSNSAGICVQLCDLNGGAAACGASQKCAGFTWVDPGFSACEPILSQDAGPNCTFPIQPSGTFTGPCSSTAYQCPLGSPMAGTWYPGADPTSCGSNPGQTLSDTDLVLNGGGVMNFNTTQTIDSMSDFSSSPVHMHDLFCSGFKYAFIDISAVWCPHCQDEATQIPESYYQLWLNAGGVVLSVLVQDVTGTAAATKDDLSNWITTYSTPYPICLDSDMSSPNYFGLTGWPDNTIVNLSNMQVLYTGGGADPLYYQTYCTVLGVTNCPAP